MFSGRETVVSETLTCLTHACPDQGLDTPRVLPEEAQALAFDAWALAKADILARWSPAVEPRNLAPVIPKAMRDAAGLVRSTSLPGWTQDETDALVEKLEESYPVRIQRQIRDAMRSSNQPRDQAAAIAAKVEELG